jgi:hypothetical protein
MIIAEPAKNEEDKAPEAGEKKPESAKDMEKKLDTQPAPKSKEDLKKEAIARGANAASNAVPPSDIKKDQVLDPQAIAKADDRAAKPMCTGKNGHPGVDCRPMPVCTGARDDQAGVNCRNPGPPSSQPPSRSISVPSGIPEKPLPAAVPEENIENKDGAGVLSVDPAVVEASKQEAKAATDSTAPAKADAKPTAAASF